MPKTLSPDMPLLAFDLETTSADKTTCGIVQYGLAAQAHPDKPIRTTSGLVACPEIITDRAMDVHGISEHLKSDKGIPVDKAIRLVLKAFEWVFQRDGLVLAYNLTFDWTVLVNSARRHHYKPDPHAYLWRIPLYDPLVVDRHVERYRKGPKNMPTLLGLFGLTEEIQSGQKAHDAEWDAEAALRITREQLGAYPLLEQIRQDRVTQTLQRWHESWAESFEKYLRANRDPTAYVARDFPYLNVAWPDKDKKVETRDLEDPPFEPN